MGEDIFIKVIGQFLAFALLASIYMLLRWMFRKLFRESESAKTFEGNGKYKVGDEIEVTTKNGLIVKGLINHVGGQSYIVKFEKPIGFNNKEPREVHSLYESEIDAISNRILKAEYSKTYPKYKIGDKLEILITEKDTTLKGFIISVEADYYVVEFEDYFSLYNRPFQKVYDFTENEINSIMEGELKGCNVQSK